MYSVLVVTLFVGIIVTADKLKVRRNFIGNFRSYFRGGVHLYGSDDVGL
jgi:hypothetical protein